MNEDTYLCDTCLFQATCRVVCEERSQYMIRKIESVREGCVYTIEEETKIYENLIRGSSPNKNYWRDHKYYDKTYGC